MWSEYTGSAVEWDQIVASFDNAHPTHQYHWTIPDQKKSATCHLLYLPRNSNRPTAAIQLLHKQHVLGLHYFRADGGLAGDHSALTDLPNWVQASARHRPWYLRVFSRAVLVPNDVLQFKSAGFTPVETKIHTGISAMITLSTPYSGTYSGNWKHDYYIFVAYR